MARGAGENRVSIYVGRQRTIMKVVMLLGEEHVIFQDRADAGYRLANALRAYANREDVVVLGIPRGGVPVALEVARALHLPWDIFLSRKLGVPGQEELGFGAVASGGVCVLDQEIVEGAGVSKQQIEQISDAAKKELERRERLYRGTRAPLTIEGQTVLLVDDGIATGSSMQAAIHALRQRKPARIVVGVPVAPQSTCGRLRPEVDELVCLQLPRYFYAIGQFYEDFSQVSDEEVTELLRLGTQPALQDERDRTQMVQKGARL